MYQQDLEDNTLVEDEAMDEQTNSDDSNNGSLIITEGHDTMLREQDRFLPIANISRIMKRSIPSNGKIAKEAKECVQECVSEFVSFVTSEASDKCKVEKRKTINGDDILYAMEQLGFENYLPALKVYLVKYREFMLRTGRGEEARSLHEDLARQATISSESNDGQSDTDASNCSIVA